MGSARSICPSNKRDRRPLEHDQTVGVPDDQPSDLSTANLPTVSVVIPSHNRREALARTVEAVLTDPATTEVVVVLDGCTDDSDVYLKELAAFDERVVVIALEHNKGRSVARQVGLSRAECEVVVLLDDDVTPSDSCISGHALNQQQTAADAIVVGYMPVESPPRANRTQRLIARLYSEKYEATCARYEKSADAILPSLWGGNISFRRAVGTRIGLLSPGFENLFHEDTDFGLRCQAAGVKAAFDRSLRASHVFLRTPSAFYRDARESGMGMRLLNARHGASVAVPKFEGPALVRKLISNQRIIEQLNALTEPLLNLPSPIAMRLLKAVRRLNVYAGAEVEQT